MAGELNTNSSAFASAAKLSAILAAYGLTVADNKLTITGSADATKTLKFEVDGQSSGADLTIDAGAQTADRTLSVPVMTGNDTIACLGVANTFSEDLTLSKSVNSAVRNLTTNTNAGTLSVATIEARNDLGTASRVIIGQYSSAYGSSLWGTSLANMSLIQALGASSNGLMLGVNGVNKPIIFGINATEVGRFASTGLTIATGASAGLTIAATSGTTLTVSSTGTTAVSLAGGMSAAGRVVSTGTAGIGYATGAGGTVTQATSRTTGVTINKTCGQITTNSTSLSSGSEASFVVTNSTVSATDTVVACIASGATSADTKVSVVGVAAGSFTIMVANLSGGVAETGSVVINFAVIKAVSA